MELYEFNDLELNAKAEFIWQHGTHVATVRNEDGSYTLYTTPNFYSEIVLRDLKITEIRAFKRGVHLDKYVYQVNLDALF